jgi:Uncharacterized protein conserved in bacteria (DUF2066)
LDGQESRVDRPLFWTLIFTFLLLIAASRAEADDAVYRVSGVKVDATDRDAASAKMKAISEAQVKAFGILLDRIAEDGADAKLRDLPPGQIGRMLASLSIEEERTGPGRYIGKLTINFLPDKVRETLARAGVAFTEKQAPRIVVVPVWSTGDGATAWDENPWRRAWQDLKAENAVVPIMVPLGDLNDAEAVSVDQALAGDADKLEALRLRYQAESVLVAVAEPVGENAIHAKMQGDTPLGRVLFDKTYTVESGGVAAAAQSAAQRFHRIMIQKWKQQTVTEARAEVQAASLNIAVPFSNPSEFSVTRGRLMSTPGVAGVDISTISGNGAIIRLSYTVPFQQLQASLQMQRMILRLHGNSWVLQSY